MSDPLRTDQHDTKRFDFWLWLSIATYAAMWVSVIVWMIRESLHGH